MFLIIHLTSFCEARQLVKFPKLIEHYITHKAENKNISILVFLKIHYFDEQVVDSDYEEDMKLPFKTPDLSGIAILLNIPPDKEILQLQHHMVYVDYSGDFSYSEKFYPSVPQKIWEPPKI